ncbi:MAG TPA: ATP synthase subunit I [Acidimicrobiia bacterium]|nr:ATP synthase subunit I [Acidimicrobiia bacterium]
MGAEPVDTFTTAIAGGAIESQIAADIARHALYVAPAVVVIGAVFAGTEGALGAAVALLVVALNFLGSAAALGWAARISAAAVATVALGGYVVRLGVITGVALAVKQLDAVDFPVFCIVLVATHLGLLVWELRSVSLSLAAPGLRPRVKE